MSSLDLSAFVAKVERTAKELTDERLLMAVGMAGKRIGTDAVKSDIGDLSMSNWRRGRPVQLGSRFDVKGDNAVEIGPGKRARGPVRVLTEGRKAGASRKGRPVSSSRGKGTWTAAQTEMERELPKVAHDHVTKVLRRNF